MNDDSAVRPDDEARDELRHLLETRPKPSPEVAAALAELEAARAATGASLDQLSSSAQSALDIPAKIRRNPVKTAALIGGTGFLLAGGPRRVARFAVRKVRPARPDPYAGLLPPEIERILKDAGLAKDPEVRRALNQDFADYLKQKGKYEPQPTAASSLWRTFDRVAGPLGTAGARILVQRLMEAEHDQSVARAEARRRARQKGTTGP